MTSNRTRARQAAPRLAILVTCLTGVAAAALGLPASQSGVEDIVDQHLVPMIAGAHGFSGPGADLLLGEGGSAHFLAIGERHGTHETPRLTDWLLRELRPAGYEAFAIEVGPFSAARLAALAAADAPMEALTTFTLENPFTIPFFWWREELEMLVTAASEGYEIWGLDQEFVGSGRLHLARLAQLAPNPEASALVGEWIRREIQGLRHYQETGSTREAIFFTLTGEDVAALRSAFEGVGEALSIVDELAASAHVYQLFGAGENYRSNHARIGLMKRHLAESLAAPAGPEPTGGGRVLVKLGSVHAGRGYSPLNQLDVGNQVAELATLRNGDSLHVLVAGRTFVSADGQASDTLDSVPHLAPVLSRVEGDDWAVMDLRALRPLFHSESGRAGHEALADTAWAYDLLVVAPVFRAAERIEP